MFKPGELSAKFATASGVDTSVTPAGAPTSAVKVADVVPSWNLSAPVG